MEDALPSPIHTAGHAIAEINNFYTPTIYEKGAEVIRMLKTMIGPEQFRKGMDLYFERHDGTAATIEQFVRCFAGCIGPEPRPVHVVVSANPERPRYRRKLATTPPHAALTLDLAQIASADAQASQSNSRW